MYQKPKKKANLKKNTQNVVRLTCCEVPYIDSI